MSRIIRKALALVLTAVMVFSFAACVGGSERPNVPGSYSVTFHVDGGSNIASITQASGSQIAKPADPTKAGYTFSGWYYNEALTRSVSFPFTLTQSVNIYAKWRAEGEAASYMVTFNVNGGSSVASVTQAENTQVTAPAIPAKAGYTFEGWFYDAALSQPASFPFALTKNVTLYAKWQAVPVVTSYTVIFQANGGVPDSFVVQDSGTQVTKPADPTRAGYSFEGWFYDAQFAQPVTFPFVLTKNTALYAMWKLDSGVVQYTVTFNTLGGSSVSPVTQNASASLSQPASPTFFGYTFAGWFYDAALTQPVTFPVILTQNWTLYAKWTPSGGAAPSQAPLYGEALSQRIAGEGIVMLKNDNNALPLNTVAGETKLSVFGWGATDGGFVLSGTGSGGGTMNNPVRLRAALETPEASAQAAYPGADPFGPGFECFSELFTIGTNFRSARTISGIDQNQLNRTFNLIEPTIGADVMNRARTFSDVAVMVISRLGAEGMDLPTNIQYKQTSAGNQTDPAATQQNDTTRHYLQLTTNEEALIKQIKASSFSKVILLVNSCNALELGFINDAAFGIDAALLVGAPGSSGAYAIRRVLNGTIAPSGKTADTFAYNLKNDPAFNNAASRGVITYSGVSQRFIEYREDIYLGYRYYETAGADGKINYSNTVQFPFGFGLTYADFEWDIVSVSPAPYAAIKADTKFRIDVNVKNVGTRVGQDVVQVYVTAPYTVGGIEKPHVVLVAYAKTELLYPQHMEDAASGKYNAQRLTLEFDSYDFASYDCYDKNNNGFTGYELEKGNYEIKLQTDAHTVKSGAKSALNGVSNGKIGYVVGTIAEVKFDQSVTVKDLAGNDRELMPAQNYFTNGSGHMSGARDADQYSFGIPIDGSAGTNAVAGTSGGGSTGTAIPLMSRANLTLPAQAVSRAKNYTLPGGNEKPGWNTTVEGKMPVTGKTGSLRLISGGMLTSLGTQLGADYNDPQWDDLLDQMTAAELWNLVREGNYNTATANSVGKPRLHDLDGPSGLSEYGSLISSSIKNTWVAYPASAVLAQTFSRKLAYNYGVSVGKEAYSAGVGGWYAPGANLHRSAFGGRNFEYFSEDPLLSGLMAADVSYGARAHGIYTYLKHFAAAETETSRGSLRTWLSEQALRELYLKPFEIAVRRGGASGIMTSFNNLGAVWTGGSKPLLSNILRGEWGFRGTVCTEYFAGSGDWMNADQGLRAGTDLWTGPSYPTISSTTGQESLILLRQSAKNILYAVANAWWWEENIGVDSARFAVNFNE
ncbi:MAG: InlB B-repeat-containing protein [Firmicutes bacterium]|nr:InlB B-repeat-containing protein [Bacillota bacterium]